MTVSTQDLKIGSKATTAVLWSIAVYLLWTLATYLLESRMNLYQQPTIAGRYTYVLIANVVIGTIAAIWVIRSLLTSEFVTITQIGLPISWADTDHYRNCRCNRGCLCLSYATSLCAVAGYHKWLCSGAPCFHR